MNKGLEQVKQFMTAFGQPVLTTPQIPSDEVVQLRLKLLSEELNELVAAWKAGDLTECADALVDIDYVLKGAVHDFGMGEIFDELSNEVHRSNMSKLGEDGKPIHREDGKVLKGPNYSKPNLLPILEKGKDKLELDL